MKEKEKMVMMMITMIPNVMIRMLNAHGHTDDSIYIYI